MQCTQFSNECLTLVFTVYTIITAAGYTQLSSQNTIQLEKMDTSYFISDNDINHKLEKTLNQLKTLELYLTTD